MENPPSQPKKRGRPPKKNTESITPPEPPQSEATSASEAPKKRGRPPRKKTTTIEPEAASMAKPPKMEATPVVAAVQSRPSVSESSTSSASFSSAVRAERAEATEPKEKLSASAARRRRRAKAKQLQQEALAREEATSTTTPPLLRSSALSPKPTGKHTGKPSGQTASSSRGLAPKKTTPAKRTTSPPNDPATARPYSKTTPATARPNTLHGKTTPPKPLLKPTTKLNTHKNSKADAPPKSVIVPIDQIPLDRVGTGQTIEHLTFKLIKTLSAPGPWRRGYAYYRENQVTRMNLTPTGVEARVRGSYQEAYTTSLIFEADKVIPQCNCPIEDPWCKHAVAVALTAVEQQLWESFWGLEEGDPELEPPAVMNGRHQFQLRLFDEQSSGKFVLIRIIETHRDSWMRDLNRGLNATINERNPDGTLCELSPALKAELSVLQFLIQEAKLSQVNDRFGWLRLPLHHLPKLIKRLQQVENVSNEHGHRLLLPKEPLRLCLQVHPQSSGNVQTSLHWQWMAADGTVRDDWPLDEVKLFRHDLPLAYRDQRLFTTHISMQQLPPYLPKQTFGEVLSNQAGRFLFESLPKLRQLMSVDEEQLSKQLQQLKKKPNPTLSVQMIDPAGMRLSMQLSFNYDKQKVPFQRGKQEAAYVTIVNKKKERVYWLQRDSEYELDCAKRLVNEGVNLQQNNNFTVWGEEALEIYNALLPTLEKEGWNVVRQNPTDFEFMQLSPKPLRMIARLEFEESVSHFILDVSGQVENRMIPLQELQGHMEAGKKYFHMARLGFLEVPMHTLLGLSRTIQALDPEEIAPNRFRIPTYRSGLIGELQDLGMHLDMSRKFRKFWEILTAGKPMEELSVPEKVQAQLRPYQERGFQWLWFLYSYGLNGILADDMGLGKTLQALVAIQTATDRHGRFPSLIVCPTTLVTNWKNEIERFCPSLTTLDLTGNERFERYHSIRQADIVITSYAILRRDINALQNYPFRFVILDESQNIKNAESQTAVAAKQLQSQHRICLSGTPIENRLAELWSLFDFLMPGFLEDASDFRRRYILPIEERGNREAERRLKKQVFPFILRRMKRDVLQDLPPKTEQVIYCDMSDNQRQLYLDILEKEREALLEEARLSGGKINQQHVFSALTKLRQLCNHPTLLSPELSGGLFESGKFDALQELILNAIENGHRILLFSQFVEMLKLIANWLKTKKVPYEILTGQTKNRQEAVDNFNNNEAIPIFLISLKAGGTGLNLTGADTVIHYDPWWNPAAEDQATDRAYRIGQQRHVHVYRLITRSTVEEKIMKLKARKKGLVDSIISADRNIGKKLTLDDLKDILSFE